MRKFFNYFELQRGGIIPCSEEAKRNRPKYKPKGLKEQNNKMNSIEIKSNNRTFVFSSASVYRKGEYLCVLTSNQEGVKVHKFLKSDVISCTKEDVFI